MSAFCELIDRENMSKNADMLMILRAARSGQKDYKEFLKKLREQAD